MTETLTKPEIKPGSEKPSWKSRLLQIFKPNGDTSLRQTLEGIIDESDQDDEGHISDHERLLLSNILTLRENTVFNVMVPRAEIFAIDVNTTESDLLKLLTEKQFSRIPVYKDSLDDVLGTLHIKDLLAALAKGEAINIRSLIRDVPIVSPSLPLLDLLLEMRNSKRHMALVVDEHGGIDGLVTIGDVLESIVGEIEDEHDIPEAPKLQEKPDGTVLADARLDIHDFELQYGQLFTDEEREESDTLGGLVSHLAGRVPSRGEILTHESGMVFEVVEADPRRINRLKIRNVPRAQA